MIRAPAFEEIKFASLQVVLCTPVAYHYLDVGNDDDDERLTRSATVLTITPLDYQVRSIK